MNRRKISITLPVDLLEKIDREAERGPPGNRSSVIEVWLRRAARSRAADRLREETLDYYGAIGAEERAEDDALARSLGDRARRVRYDE